MSIGKPTELTVGNVSLVYVYMNEWFFYSCDLQQSPFLHPLPHRGRPAPAHLTNLGINEK